MGKKGRGGKRFVQEPDGRPGQTQEAALKELQEAEFRHRLAVGAA